jgi:serine/threonine-protein kinase RsbW
MTEPGGGAAVTQADSDSRPEVQLTVPAQPEFVRLVRVTATGLASRGGFSIDDVEDLRLAIDELCFALIGTKGRPGSLTLRYRLEGRELEVQGMLDGDDQMAVRLSEWSDQILEALVDEHEVGWSPDGGGEGRGFRMLKRAG